ncbi:UNVERIFIED_CONTAM: hypothetical protein Slati_1430200 [Sesamum latifolium]|uniref:Uncharacterized protein n=1 Tax=Sesamum latifolium TaxID=2727402 RepID=A0AAW2X4D0_9LAMI
MMCPIERHASVWSQETKARKGFTGLKDLGRSGITGEWGEPKLVQMKCLRSASRDGSLVGGAVKGIWARRIRRLHCSGQYLRVPQDLENGLVRCDGKRYEPDDMSKCSLVWLFNQLTLYHVRPKVQGGKGSSVCHDRVFSEGTASVHYPILIFGVPSLILILPPFLQTPFCRICSPSRWRANLWKAFSREAQGGGTRFMFVFLTCRGSHRDLGKFIFFQFLRRLGPVSPQGGAGATRGRGCYQAHISRFYLYIVREIELCALDNSMLEEKLLLDGIKVERHLQSK